MRREKCEERWFSVTKRDILMTILYSMIVMTAILFMPEPVMADDDFSDLTIYYFVQNNGVDTPIQGAGVSICKVADFDKESGKYRIIDDYDSLRKMKDDEDVTFEDLSVSEWMELAKMFYDQRKEPFATNVTDKKGICIFSNLNQGLYLVFEESADGDAKKYELFAPYIVSVPLLTEDGWKYHVLSEPKTKEQIDTEDETQNPPTILPSEEPNDVPEPIPQETTVSGDVSALPSSKTSGWDKLFVKTGDDASWLLFVGMMCFALILVFLAGHEKRRVDDE